MKKLLIAGLLLSLLTSTAFAGECGDHHKNHAG